MSGRKQSNKSLLVDAVRNKKPLNVIENLCEKTPNINDIREACKIANNINISIDGGYDDVARYLLDKLPD